MTRKALCLSVLEGIVQVFFVSFVINYVGSVYFDLTLFFFWTVYIIWFLLILKIINVLEIKKSEQKCKYWKYAVVRLLSFIVAIFIFLVLYVYYKIDMFPTREIWYGEGMLLYFFFVAYYSLIIFFDLIQCVLWHKKKKVRKNTLKKA